MDSLDSCKYLSQIFSVFTENCLIILIIYCRSSIAQIGEFLRMKTSNIVENASQPSLVEIAGNIGRPCNRCGKAYSSLEELQNHSPCNQETGEIVGEKNGGAGGNISCEVCGKPFKRKEHLFQHRKLHTGERPYICNVCGKAFSRKEHLVRHAVSHTGQKLHSCDMCGKSFSRKDNLHKHRKTHGIAGPYICETCGKSFVVKHYYLLHRGSHTSCSSTVGSDEQSSVNPENSLLHKCDICSKSFNTKQHLNAHKLRHRNKTTLNANSSLHSVSQQQTPVHLEGNVVEAHTVALTHNNNPLTTINNSALLTPNILHHVNPPVSGSDTQNNSAGAMIQVSSAAAYLCTPGTVVANELLETYRRMQSM